MSDQIKHECGIALVRLRKPLSFYIEKYGSAFYAVKKMYILMEKQRNRGQDGAGVANIKLNVKPGTRFISRYRSIDANPIETIFTKINRKLSKAKRDGGKKFKSEKWLQKNCAFTGELWLGHLRYGTFGKNSIEACHPFLRQNNWRSRNLVVAGNFNMTNVDELFQILINLGQHPKEKTDTVTVMEKMGHFLDEENQRLFERYKGKLNNFQVSERIENELDIQRILERSCKDFDGGYAMAGLIGSGAAFVARDPSGIRPAYFYADDEVVVVASEKPAIKTAFNVDYDEIQEVKPGHALIIDKNGKYAQKMFIEPRLKQSCSFERIYFSRGSDPDIYEERKRLGELLTRRVLISVNYDLKNTVFSFIPNTAETSFLGLMEGLDSHLIEKRKAVLIDGKPSLDKIEDLLSFKVRVEKLVYKDAKLRTFITGDDNRDDLVTHAYDTTYEVVSKGKDTIVVVDDSIVRGTTLEKSILKMLDRLEPKKIVVVSSAPQIRYPDCYGIDMSKFQEFVAFRAMLALLEDNDMNYLLDEVYQKCLKAINGPNLVNHVKELFEPFTYQEVSDKIAEIITPKGQSCKVEVIYQPVENLHKACPNHLGDWYFTGNYPTPGGNRIVNKAFVYFMEGKKVRAYA